jgi:hypothetical protein
MREIETETEKKRGEKTEKEERKGESPRRTFRSLTSEVNRAESLPATLEPTAEGYHTQRTIFSSLFDQLLRLQNVPLKLKSPSGENDFQDPPKAPQAEGTLYWSQPA